MCLRYLNVCLYEVFTTLLPQKRLIHCDQATQYGDIDLGQHWLRYQHWPRKWLVPDGTKPLPEPMLTYHQ